MRFILTKWLPWLIGVIGLLTITGCETAGFVEYSNTTTGEHWRAQNPPKASAPATLSRGSQSEMSGQAGPPRKEDTAIKQLWIIPLIGVGLIVLGVATLTLRGWFQSVPISASLASMATGAVLIAAPKIVQEAWWVIALMIGAVIVMYGISWFDNRRKLKPRNPLNPQPLSQGAPS